MYSSFFCIVFVITRVTCRNKTVTISPVNPNSPFEVPMANITLAQATSTMKPFLNHSVTKTKLNSNLPSSDTETVQPKWKSDFDKIGECVYCNPNFMKIPSFEDTMRGYDLPMGNPNPGAGQSDPGIRKQIFQPMMQNDDGFITSNSGFISSNPFFQCDSEWSYGIAHNFESYVKSKEDMSMLAKPSGGKQAISMPLAIVGFRVSVNFPPIFSRNSMQEDSVDDMKKFFVDERGSIAMAHATCNVYRVDISQFAKKTFFPPFIDALAELERVADLDDQARIKEFRNFVDNYGTHYAMSTHIGVRIVFERRYTAKERANFDDNQLKECNLVAGSKSFGFQYEPNVTNCEDPELRRMEFSSRNVQRAVISTYGSFPSTNISEWMTHIIEMHKTDVLRPTPIKRRLVPILGILQPFEFEGVLTADGNPINVSKILEWFAPAMANYCRIFDMDCRRSGVDNTEGECGINDDCRKEEWCFPSYSTARGYTCGYKTMKKRLADGTVYVGDVNIGLSPHGKGRIYFNENMSTVKFSGNFFRGRRHGVGNAYNKNGTLVYHGSYIRGIRNGPGILYNEKSGEQLFDGIFKGGFPVVGFMSAAPNSTNQVFYNGTDHLPQVLQQKEMNGSSIISNEND